MVEGRVQEETVVVELEVLLGFADAALAESQQLLALGEGPHSHGPFFKSNRHGVKRGERVFFFQCIPCALPGNVGKRDCAIVCEMPKIAKCACKSADFATSPG